MPAFIIPDMTCAHCVKTISSAIAAIDSNAKLVFDLPTHRLDVESTADRTKVVNAIEEAGYTVDKVLAQSEAGAGCCGTCAA